MHRDRLICKPALLLRTEPPRKLDLCVRLPLLEIVLSSVSMIEYFVSEEVVGVMGIVMLIFTVRAGVRPARVTADTLERDGAPFLVLLRWR